jgi:hypothetical protein
MASAGLAAVEGRGLKERLIPAESRDIPLTGLIRQLQNALRSPYLDSPNSQ